MFIKLGAIHTGVISHHSLQALLSHDLFHHINVPDVKVFDWIHSHQSLRISLGQPEKLLLGHCGRTAWWVIAERERHANVFINNLRNFSCHYGFVGENVFDASRACRI